MSESSQYPVPDGEVSAPEAAGTLSPSDRLNSEIIGQSVEATELIDSGRTCTSACDRYDPCTNPYWTAPTDISITSTAAGANNR